MGNSASSAAVAVEDSASSQNQHPHHHNTSCTRNNNNYDKNNDNSTNTNGYEEEKINNFPVITEVEPFNNNNNNNMNLNSNLDSSSSPLSVATPSESWAAGAAGGGGGLKGGRGMMSLMGKRNPSFFGVTGSSSNNNNNNNNNNGNCHNKTPSSPLPLRVMDKGLVEAGITRVLVLYCGGTIGMKKDPVKGYLPLKNYLSSFLRSHDRFHDQDCLETLLRKQSTHFDVHSMDTALGDILLLPHFVDGKKRVAYQIHELADLKDSCNMVEADYISLAATIQQHYHSYDGFLILHGTDTMAYTASALSFLLEDLGKSVVITGSQVPFTELRNDAYENFLGSLILSSHYCLPEVTVYFNNHLFRGNRVKKVNSQAFAAFTSPNMKPLGTMGVDIELDWSKIHRSSSLQPFRASRALHSCVVCLRLYPGITATTIKAITSGGVKGLVLETFGSGNAPDDNPPLLAALADAVQRGVVIVNVTQCTTGAAVAGYAVGYALSCTGVISGRDMTVECALMKLNYLLSHPEYSQADVTRLMGESLRGELTLTAEDSQLPPPPSSSPPSSTAHASASASVASTLSGLIMQQSLVVCPEAVQDSVEELLRPVLLHAASARGDLAALEELLTRDFDINTPNPSTGRTCLYVAMSSNSPETVRWLVTEGVNVHLRDHYGVTALVYAIRLLVYSNDIQRTVQCIGLLKDAGSSLCGVSLTEELLHFAAVGNVDIIKMIYECDGSLDCADLSGKTLLHIAALHGRLEVVRWVARKADLLGLFGRADRCGRRALDEARLLLRGAEVENKTGSEGGAGLSLSSLSLSVDVLKDVIAALEEGGQRGHEAGEGGGLVEF